MVAVQGEPGRTQDIEAVDEAPYHVTGRNGCDEVAGEYDEVGLLSRHQVAETGESTLRFGAIRREVQVGQLEDLERAVGAELQHRLGVRRFFGSGRCRGANHPETGQSEDKE